MQPQPDLPTGLMPRWITDIIRKKQIDKSIKDYLEYNGKDDQSALAVPIEWLEEYNEIVERQMNNKPYEPINGISLGYFTNEEALIN